MNWLDLVPSEFDRMVKEEGVCVIPMGSLERHGEHVPFGCDMVIAEAIAGRAVQAEPAVLFPGYFLGQVHEAACFTGTVNLPQAFAVELLAHVLDGIAANGFKKIAILSGHGGNSSLIQYTAISMLDERKDYTLYVIDAFEGMTEAEHKAFDAIWEATPYYHADEVETSIYMACRPGLVRMDLAPEGEMIPLERYAELRKNGVRQAMDFYSDFPGHVTGTPSLATEEKGRRALDIFGTSAARALRAIKEDKVAPALRKEFYEKVMGKGK